MGTVEGIHVAPRERAECRPVARVNVVAGRGVEGDRHFRARERGDGADLSLIEAEALDALERDHAIRLAPGESRRQITTRGIDLNALVGRRFSVGGVEAVATELCEPCLHLAKLTERGVLRGLAHRGGIYAEVISDGEIGLGDPVVDRGPAEIDC